MRYLVSVLTVLFVALFNSSLPAAQGETKLVVREITPPNLNITPCDVAIKGDYVFMAGWRNGIHVFDISDFNNPKWLKRIEAKDEISSVEIKGNYLYAATTGLIIYDIGDIENIKVVNSLESEHFYRNVKIDGDYLYVNCPDVKCPLIVYDISNPLDPQIIREIETPG